MNQYEQCTLDEVAEALSFLDASVDRDTWVTIGMAIKSEFGDMGKSEFESWSMSSDKYSKSDFSSTWRSLKQGGGVTIKTLFKMAVDAGYKPEPTELSEQEKQARHNEAQARRAEREKEAIAEQKLLDDLKNQIAGVSQAIWASDFLSEEGESEYLERKQIRAFGARFVARSFMVVVDLDKNTAYAKYDRDEMLAITKLKKDCPDAVSFLWLKKNTLVLPMYDMAGKLWSLQFILPNGTKLFIKRSKKSGTCFLVGTAPTKACPVMIAEGFATGASIFMATGFPVYVCWDAGNLLTMAPIIRNAFPDMPFLICGDNDRHDEKNPGLTKARKAANDAKCAFVVPTFDSLMLEIKEAANA